MQGTNSSSEKFLPFPHKNVWHKDAWNLSKPSHRDDAPKLSAASKCTSLACDCDYSCTNEACSGTSQAIKAYNCLRLPKYSAYIWINLSIFEDDLVENRNFKLASRFCIIPLQLGWNPEITYEINMLGFLIQSFRNNKLTLLKPTFSG